MKSLVARQQKHFNMATFPPLKLLFVLFCFFHRILGRSGEKRNVKKKHKKSANRSIAVEPGKQHLNMDDARIV